MYTGRDTKLVMNSREVPSKMSTIEATVNKMIYFILFADIVLTLAVTIARSVWNSMYLKYQWYICGEGAYKNCGVELFEQNCSDKDTYNDASYFATFFILFNNFLPLSLYVTLEIVNFVQAYYVDQDLEMYDETQDTPALARTSNQNGDLGQIEYVFSDKTGTLTCNEMKFRRCAVSGQIYGNVVPGGPAEAPAGGDEHSRTPSGSVGDSVELPGGSAAAAAADAAGSVPPVGSTADGVPVGKPLGHLRMAAALGGADQAAMHFAVLLASCHTVVMEKADDGTESFQAESPDEEALVDGGIQLGYRFKGATSESIFLEQTMSGEELVVTKLALIPFDSTRKRMSVVVKVGGEYRLYIKGADNVMFDRAGAGAATNFQKGLKDGSKVRDDDGFALVGGKQLLEAQLEGFAAEGLRTLVLAVKILDPAWAEEWVNKWNHAQTLMDRDAACVEVASEIEDSGLTVVGATAIEDRLQDGVPGTIADLKEAGIKVWVLTGDKMTTAINIGFSCRLLTPDMTLIMLDKEDPNSRDENGNPPRTPAQKLNYNYSKYEAITRSDVVVKNYRRKVGGWLGAMLGIAEKDGEAGSANASGSRAPRSDRPSERPAMPQSPSRRNSLTNAVPELHELDTDHLALIVDGPSLTDILDDPELTRKLLHLGCFCRAVVACRVSPAQKQLVVKMVKTGLPHGPITLSIGDGANDVPMIQEAQIGVGISGKEGRQAVNSADFAIAQFRFLKRLLLVHGRFNYRRTSKVIIYSFYKNIVLVIVLFIYSVYSSFSGQSLYGADSWCYSGYNFFLGLPPFFLGFFDMDVKPEIAMKFHKLYFVGLKNQDLNLTKMIESFLFAIWDAFIIYYLTHLSYNDSTWQARGKTTGINVFGNAVFAVMIWAMMYRMCLTFSSWNALSIFSIFFSFAFYLVFIFSYSAIGPYNTTLGDVGEYAFYEVPTHMFGVAGFWVTLILVPLTSFCSVFLLKAIRTEFFTTRDVLALEWQRLHGGRRDSATNLLSGIAASDAPGGEGGMGAGSAGAKGGASASLRDSSSSFVSNSSSGGWRRRDGPGGDLDEPGFKVGKEAVDEVHAGMDQDGTRESHGHRDLTKARSSFVMDHVEDHSWAAKNTTVSAASASARSLSSEVISEDGHDGGVSTVLTGTTRLGPTAKNPIVKTRAT
jgi:magnesium-transporting ATPase (P-type)